MPVKEERKLKAQGKKKGLSGEKLDAYVYSTLQKVTDWKPGKKGKS